jgi:hypothetical protein
MIEAKNLDRSSLVELVKSSGVSLRDISALEAGNYLIEVRGNETALLLLAETLGHAGGLILSSQTKP